jgi:hypothetical protein
VNLQKLIRLLSTPITLIVLLGLLVGGVAWGYKIITAQVVIPRTPCVTIPMTELATNAVTVSVFNAGDRTGLARRVAEVLSDGGYVIGRVGNTDEKVLTIIVVGAQIDSPEVKLVASWFVDPEIQSDDRVDHSVDVMVGNGYDEETGMVSEPPTTLQIPGGNVCLPPTPTPTNTVSPTGTATTSPTGPTGTATTSPTGSPTKPSARPT